MSGYQKGQVLIAQVAQGLALGVLVEATGNRLKVIFESGNVETWSKDRIVFETPMSLRTAEVSQTAFAVNELREKLQKQALDIDLESLWELLAEQSSSYPVSEIAELAFGFDDPESVAALQLKIALEPMWFKAQSNKELTPRPASYIQAEKQRIFRENQEAERLERVTQAIKVARETKNLDLTDADTRLGVNWLRTLAIEGAENRDGARAVELLSRIKGQATSDGPFDAFELLVELGVFADDEILSVHRFGFAKDFPDDVQNEAIELANTPISQKELINRTELGASGVGPLAIDDPWTTDVDDALWVEDLPDGRWQVHILITDVFARIPPDSLVAREGMTRAASLYLPDRTIPMLPPILSKGALAFTTGVQHPALDFICTIDSFGLVSHFEIKPVFTKLGCRITYEEADAQIQNQVDSHPASKTLHTLNFLAQALATRRVQDGAVIIEKDEHMVRVIDGKPQLHRIEHDSAARRLVSEFMILACTLAGRFAKEHDIPVVYRRQPPPDDKTALGEWDPTSKASTLKLLRSMRKAELTTQPDFHWAMGVVGYTQVTAPLRRFQDYVVHGQLKGFINDGVAPLNTQELLKLFGDLEARGEALSATEREARRYWLLKYLKQYEGQEVSGEVVSTQGSRAMVQLDETGLNLTVTGFGHVDLGTKVQVVVRSVDPRRDRVFLAPTS